MDLHFQRAILHGCGSFDGTNKYDTLFLIGPGNIGIGSIGFSDSYKKHLVW